LIAKKNVDRQDYIARSYKKERKKETLLLTSGGKKRLKRKGEQIADSISKLSKRKTPRAYVGEKSKMDSEKRKGKDGGNRHLK